MIEKTKKITKKIILIIDDQRFIRIILRDLLTQQGYEIIDAKDSIEAFANYRQFHPDLVLIDLIIPDENGFKIIDKIRTYDCRAKFVMMTSESTEKKEGELNSIIKTCKTFVIIVTFHLFCSKAKINWLIGWLIFLNSFNAFFIIGFE